MAKSEHTAFSTTSTKRHWVDIVHSPVSAWIILLASVMITIAAWHLSVKYAEEKAGDRFIFQVNDAKAAIAKRMLDYEQMLRSAKGLFASAQGQVSRTSWKNYIDTLALDRYYPGVQGVGYSKWIQADDRAAVIKSVRAEGYPDFTIKPEGDRPVYTSIIYLEPFSGRNLRAFGYDMFSEPTRREAMIRARDTGEPALSGRVTLVQETKQDIQYGFLMYLPVYKRPVQTLAERQTELAGFVYSPFRIRDLMHGILGKDLPELSFDIYDGDQVHQDHLLYSSNNKTPASRTAAFNTRAQLLIAGHTWTIEFSSNEAFDEATTTAQPLIIAIGGFTIDVLLFVIILSLSRLRHKAMSLAASMVNKARERDMHFQAISDTSNDGIVSINEDGAITYCNKAAEQMFGYTQDEVLGQAFSILFDRETGIEFEQGTFKLMGKDICKGAGNLTELQGRRKNGATFPLELSVSYWSTEDHRYYTAGLRDITERKKVDRMKDEFISTVSHELRTPLTSIRGSLVLMANDIVGEIPQQAHKLLNISVKNVERLNRLINDILDIEKIESGKLRMSIQHCVLEDLLQQAIQLNQPSAHAADIQLRLTNHTDLRLEVDPDRFLQIMSNLISNAIKFSAAGQSINISTSVHVDRVRISIEDHGTGIPEEFRAHIFKKFAQADSSDTRSKGGTGLGLSIVKALVEILGGKIGFDSEPGKGTTFHVDLPIAQELPLRSNTAS